MGKIKELQREEVRSKKRQIKTLEREIGRLEKSLKEDSKV
jgi:phage host-nuclease inhibitor protein Gam